MCEETKKNVIKVLENPEQALRDVLEGKTEIERVLIMEEIFSGISLAGLKFKEFEILASKEFSKINRNAGQKGGLKL